MLSLGGEKGEVQCGGEKGEVQCGGGGLWIVKWEKRGTVRERQCGKW